MAAMNIDARGPPAATSEAERSAVKAVSAAWKSAYNSGDAAAVSALYTEDAVLSAPGEPPVLGRAAISAYFVRKVAEFSAAGVTVEDAPLGDVVASGDLAWQWQTGSSTSRVRSRTRGSW